MLDRCLHVIELPLSAFKLCFGTLKVLKEKTIHSYRTWGKKGYNGFSDQAPSWAGSSFFLPRLINMEINLPDFRCLERCLCLPCFSLSRVPHLVAATQMAWGHENACCQWQKSVAESLKDSQENIPLAISLSNPRLLKSQVSCFLQSWWSSPRAFLIHSCLLLMQPTSGKYCFWLWRKPVSRKFLGLAIPESTMLTC